MSRFIDYDAIDYKNYNMIGKSQEFMKGVVYMAERIEEAPSIDICFCKDCEHWANNEDYDCEVHSGAWQADDFCSCGERSSSEKPNKSEIPTGSERSSE